MIQFRLNPTRMIASVRRFGTSLPSRMRPAVRKTSSIFLKRIVDKTPSPPTPPAQIYIRTGRLKAGWRDAANELGFSIPKAFPPPRAGYYGSPPRDIDLPGLPFEETVNTNKVSFLMRNNVPYAFFVEVAGPGFPPRGGVFMVTRSSFETEPDFIREIQIAWASIP
jgi:hypothetical protein